MKTNLPCIHKLFYRMRNMYGGYWVIAIGDRPAEEIKADWLEGLKEFSAETIGKVLADLKAARGKRPPDLEGFIKLVKDKQHCKAGHLSNTHWEAEKVDKCTSSTRDSRMAEINKILNKR